MVLLTIALSLSCSDQVIVREVEISAVTDRLRVTRRAMTATSSTATVAPSARSRPAIRSPAWIGCSVTTVLKLTTATRTTAASRTARLRAAAMASCDETAPGDEGYERCDDGTRSMTAPSHQLPSRCLRYGIVRTDLAEGEEGYEACDDGDRDPANSCKDTAPRRSVVTA